MIINFTLKEIELLYDSIEFISSLATDSNVYPFVINHRVLLSTMNKLQTEISKEKQFEITRRDLNYIG